MAKTLAGLKTEKAELEKRKSAAQAKIVEIDGQLADVNSELEKMENEIFAKAARQAAASSAEVKALIESFMPKKKEAA